MTRKILIIEDDRDIAGILKTNLADAKYDIDIFHSGKQGLERALASQYDLIILDLNLPDIDGMEICRSIRDETRYIPILILTCRDSEVDRVLGLEFGADDYLTKPFSIRELLARVKALFRRMEAFENLGQNGVRDTLEFDDLTVDGKKRRVVVRGRSVPLTAKEFDLLHFFALNPEKVFNRAQLLDQVWGYAYEGYEHTVNSHINRLRAKIENDPSNPVYIKTVWGIGYKFSGGEGE